MSFKKKFARLEKPQQREFEKWAKESAGIGDLYDVVAEKTSKVEIYKDYLSPDGTKKSGIPRGVLKKISDRLVVVQHSIRLQYDEAKSRNIDVSEYEAEYSQTNKRMDLSWDKLGAKYIAKHAFMVPMIEEVMEECDEELEKYLAKWAKSYEKNSKENTGKEKSSSNKIDFGKMAKELDLPVKAEKDVQKIAAEIARNNSAAASKITETVMDKYGNQAPTKGTVKDMVKKINAKLKAQAKKN